MNDPDPSILVGQVWSLRRCARRAAVHKIETLNGETIVHVSILKHDGKLELGHAPFTHTAFVESIDRPLPAIIEHADFRDGYGYWRKEYDRGVAGVFTVNVCDL